MEPVFRVLASVSARDQVDAFASLSSPNPSLKLRWRSPDCARLYCRLHRQFYKRARFILLCPSALKKREQINWNGGVYNYRTILLKIQMAELNAKYSISITYTPLQTRFTLRTTHPPPFIYCTGKRQVLGTGNLILGSLRNPDGNAEDKVD